MRTFAVVSGIGAGAALFIAVFWHYSFDEGIERSEFAQEAGFRACQAARELGQSWDPKDVRAISWDSSKAAFQPYAQALGKFKRVRRYDVDEIRFKRGRDVQWAAPSVRVAFEKGEGVLRFRMRREHASRWMVEEWSIRGIDDPSASAARGREES